jgi:putative lipoic acid-binding regulatory protein
VERLPSIDLLEAAHRFPGPYMFKAIGRSENGFVARAVAAARQGMEADFDPPFSVRETPGGRHVAVTLEPVVRTPEEVLAVYRRLMKLSGLVLLF